MRSCLLLALFCLLHGLLGDLNEIFKIHYLLLILGYTNDLAEVVCVRSTTASNTHLLFI